MTKIYTKKGDAGETGLSDGKRVRKSAVRIHAYGDVDELNALLGRARSLNKENAIDKIIKKIQNDLFELGALLASADKSRQVGIGGVEPADITFIEQTIDYYTAKLPPLKDFILPGGTELAAALHVARAVTRRAEREIIRLADEEYVENVILAYMNRLSDLLFVLARWANHIKKKSDITWKKRS